MIWFPIAPNAAPTDSVMTRTPIVRFIALLLHPSHGDKSLTDWLEYTLTDLVRQATSNQYYSFPAKVKTAFFSALLSNTCAGSLTGVSVRSRSADPRLGHHYRRSRSS